MTSEGVIGGQWDYVIVGGGTAGCVLANRLSVNPKIKVLLLEAGGSDRTIRTEIPLLLSYALGHPAFDWGWISQPEPHLDQRRLALPRGRILGGSSTINGMVYVRGHAFDFDTWRDLGNDGWGWRDVLPYFIRSEAAQGAPQPGHGQAGEWAISDPGVRWDPLDAYIEAAVAAGIPATADYNSGENEGVAYFRAAVKNGRRQSTAKAFLRPVRNRPNLTVWTGAEVARLIVEGRAVTGVELIHGGTRRRVGAAREVILSAGAYASPALLERSGIGAPGRLGPLGIGVVHALPGVGENLQDHWQVRIQHKLQNTTTLNQWVNNYALRMLMGARYVLTRTGPLAGPPALLAAFARTRPDLPAPDLQVHVMAASYGRVGGPMDPFSGITSSVSLLRPDSRGTVHIKSKNDFEQPDIKHKFLESGGDAAAAQEAVNLIRRIAAQPQMARYAPEEIAPGRAVTGTDEIMDYVRQVASTTFHPVGTCKMGQDPMAVVAPDLRVHGLTGLRVADASIMPVITSGNTAAPVVMIAEKAADLILGVSPPPAA
ncbi:MAG: GMC family oxidoreductase [Qingshengfaniella sp.]